MRLAARGCGKPCMGSFRVHRFSHAPVGFHEVPLHVEDELVAVDAEQRHCTSRAASPHLIKPAALAARTRRIVHRSSDDAAPHADTRKLRRSIPSRSAF